MSFRSAGKFLAVALMLSALPNIALASRARVEALGLQNDFVLDYVNVETYPSAIVRYQNLVFGELGVKDDDGNDLSDFSNNRENRALETQDRAMGVHLGDLFDGRLGVLGIYLNENAAALSPTTGSEFINRNENEAWNVIWGYRFQNAAVGFEVNRSHSSISDTDDTIDPFTGPSSMNSIGTNGRGVFNEALSYIGSPHWNTLGFGAGISIDWESAGYNNFFDASGEIRSYSFEITDDSGMPTETSFQDDNGASIAFNARARLQASDDVSWTPVFNFVRFDLGTDFADAATPANDFTADNTFTTINAGIAGEWNLREDDMLILGVGFQNSELDFEDFDTVRDPDDDGSLMVDYTVLPNLFGALEADVWSWLSLRLGASKPLYSKLTITDDTGEETEVQDSPFLYSVGLGFHFGKVDIDAVMNQDWAFTGGYLASGKMEVPFTRLSAVYRF